MLHVQCQHCGAEGYAGKGTLPDAAVHCTSPAGDPPGSADGCCSVLGHTHEEHIAHILVTRDATSRPVTVTATAQLEGSIG